MANVRVRMPLFDRLTDREPGVSQEPRPQRSLSRRELKESVRRELERLFNTRIPLAAHRMADDYEWSVVDYGIPDFFGFSPGNPRDENRLGAILARAIEAFEPRLRGVKVTVEGFQGRYRPFRAQVDATLVVASIEEPVSFPARIGSEPGGSEVNATT